MAARAGVAQASHKTTRLRDETPWQELAPCRDVDPEMFFDPTRYAQAQLVCAGCPFKQPCLRLRHGAAGVWGGKVFNGDKTPHPASPATSAHHTAPTQPADDTTAQENPCA